MRKLVAILVCGGFVLSAAAASAFPPFKLAFDDKYVKPAPAEAQQMFKATGCNVCHVKGEEKKKRNPYGHEIHEVLEARGLKNEQIKEALKVPAQKEEIIKVLEEAFKEVEAKKGKNGATFGELLKAGKLPE